jgi:hypothetical protein
MTANEVSEECTAYKHPSHVAQEAGLQQTISNSQWLLLFLTAHQSCPFLTKGIQWGSHTSKLGYKFSTAAGHAQKTSCTFKIFWQSAF